MNFLLDTHVLLWWLFDDRRLSEKARQVIRDRGNGIFVSSASAWEISTKHRLGKLSSAKVLVQDIEGWVERAGLRALPITIVHAQKAGAWPHPHRDPFDRMLAAQSAIEDLPLVTQDGALEPFGIRIFW